MPAVSLPALGPWSGSLFAVVAVSALPLLVTVVMAQREAAHEAQQPSPHPEEQEVQPGEPRA